ncbi:hypothetical protein ACKRLN_08410 [Anaerococcus sp. DFU013_CI05]|uniref:hypothetical protein n=1 Tax=Anaerococcus sp. AH8042_DFU013_CI05 TaxID=3385202 RepID=UPI003A5220F6
MNKKLLTAALSATLVLGFGTQNVHAADTTIPAEVGDQTVNTREGGVAETARDGREEKELTKTDSTLTPADGDTKVFPAKNEKKQKIQTITQQIQLATRKQPQQTVAKKYSQAKKTKINLEKTKKQPQQTVAKKYSQAKKMKINLEKTKKQPQQMVVKKYSQAKKTEINLEKTKKQLQQMVAKKSSQQEKIIQNQKKTTKQTTKRKYSQQKEKQK